MTKNIVFGLSASKELTKKIIKILNLENAEILTQRFADGEILVSPQVSVRGHDITLVQSISNPVNENLMELLIAIDALKRSSAKSISVVIPYMGYSRQDRKTNPREPITFKLLANMLQIAGATRILTFDIHSDQTQGFFDIPFDSLRASLFLLHAFIKKSKINNFVVVSPDYGGVKRAKEISQWFNLPLAIIDKRRPAPNQVEVSNILGNVKDQHCVLFDDMIDTGGTMIAASRLLKSKGAKTVSILATHALFNGNAKENFINAFNEKIIDYVFVTDTIEQNLTMPNINVVSVATPIARVIELLNIGYGSMSFVIKDDSGDLKSEIRKLIKNDK